MKIYFFFSKLAKNNWNFASPNVLAEMTRMNCGLAKNYKEKMQMPNGMKKFLDFTLQICHQQENDAEIPEILEEKILQNLKEFLAKSETKNEQKKLLEELKKIISEEKLTKLLKRMNKSEAYKIGEALEEEQEILDKIVGDK